MKAALIVGCASFEDATIANLTYSSDDADAVAHTLVSVCGFDAADVLLLNAAAGTSAPTRARLLKWLAEVDVRPRRRLDLLVFFFSGHGFRSAVDSRDYLVTVDTVASALEDTALALDRVVALLRQWQARHTILFIDACRATAEAGKAHGAITPMDPRSVVPDGFITFHSCSTGQRSFEADEIKKGIFTHALVRGLSDEGRCKTVYELNSYLTAAVPRVCSELGKPRQDPWSHVEPIGAEHLSIVSEQTRRTWTAETPLGVESRPGSVPRLLDATTVKAPVTCIIDFGTSFSAIAAVDSARVVRLVPDSRGQILVPSVVTFNRDADYLVGWPAVAAAAERPELALRLIKRRLGEPAPYAVLGRSIAPELAASLVIGSLKRNAEEYLGLPVRQAVVSFPANFSYAQTNALMRACEWAGFEVLRGVTEPSAAAVLMTELLSATNDSDDVAALVVDLGGGTLDVCIVDVGRTSTGELVVEVVGACGDDIGGADYDEVLAGELVQALRARLASYREPSRSELWQAAAEAERAKVRLNHESSVTLVLPNVETQPGMLEDVTTTVSREKFRALTASLNETFASTIMSAFDTQEGYPRRVWEELPKYVLLSGQATKLFVVRELLDQLSLGGTLIERYQEIAVAKGLAAHVQSIRRLGAEALATHLLLQSRHRAIGFRCMKRVGDPEYGEVVRLGGEDANVEVKWIIENDTRIPTRKSVRAEAVGTEIDLTIVEGPMGGRDTVSITTVPLTVPPQLELAVDIDSDSSAVLTVRDDAEGGQVLALQLNNPHLRPEGSEFDDLQMVGLTPLSPDEPTAPQ